MILKKSFSQSLSVFSLHLKKTSQLNLLIEILGEAKKLTLFPCALDSDCENKQKHT